MTLRHRRSLLRSSLASLFAFASILGAAVIACSSDNSATGGTGTDGGTKILADGAVELPDGRVVAPDDSGASSGGSSGNPDGGYDTSPSHPEDFPLDTPGIGGYTLTDAFPNAEPLDVPSVITFAKLDTANKHPFVLERTGIIRRMDDNGTWDYQHPVVTFSPKVNVQGGGGAVGMVLHPKFGDGTGNNDFIYVWYNACAGSTGGPFGCDQYSQKLERYTFHSATNTADTPTLLIEEQEFINIHNAGRMMFGPDDGFLYFGNGDDGDEGDFHNHQNINNAMFAGIFRIDVDNDPTKSHTPPAHTPQAPHTGVYFRANYSIPNDNPFVGQANAVEEYYALGFRNPYSWSFDQKANANGTHDMWLGDVGDSFREEINHIVKGGNYQWPVKEGELTNLLPDVTTYVPGTIDTPPTFAYSHAEIADLSSIFGGFVYHGASLPELEGKYLYTDWITGRIWSLDITQSPPTRTLLVQNQYKYQPLGWGQDNSGETYFIQYGLGDTGNNAIHGGHVKKIVHDTVLANIPKRLSDTKLFTDVKALTPAADLVPYEVSSPLWSDGAVKSRWIKVPAGQKVTVTSGTNTTLDGTFKYPLGTMFIKQFDMAADLTTTRSRHLETRVMVVGNDTTWGYTFRWREDGSDADLVSDPRDETLTDSATGATRNWHYPSPAQCWGCHRNGYEDDQNSIRNDKYRILGFTPKQLGSQVTDFVAKGIFDSSVQPVAPLPTPGDTTNDDLGAKAYAYLSANCSQCHHEYANYTGGGQTWIATYGAGGLDARHLTDTVHNFPMSIKLASVLGRPNLKSGKLIVPGQPDSSVLMGRIDANDPDVRMPPIARNVVDPTGAAVIRAWITAGCPDPK